MPRRRLSIYGGIRNHYAPVPSLVYVIFRKTGKGFVITAHFSIMRWPANAAAIPTSSR